MENYRNVLNMNMSFICRPKIIDNNKTENLKLNPHTSSLGASLHEVTMAETASHFRFEDIILTKKLSLIAACIIEF